MNGNTSCTYGTAYKRLRHCLYCLTVTHIMHHTLYAVLYVPVCVRHTTRTLMVMK